MRKLPSYILLPTLRTHSREDLNTPIHEAGFISTKYLRERRESSVISLSQQRPDRVNDEFIDVLIYNLFGRISDKPSRQDILVEYESFKDALKVEVDAWPGEDVRYIDILSAES